VRRRRGPGEGSVYFDDRSQLWVGVVNLAPDELGKRRRKYVRAKRKQDVLSKLDTIKADLAVGLPLGDQRRSTAEYLRWWCAIVVPGSVKDSTARGYEWIIERYVIPAVGSKPLAQLHPEHVQTMLRGMEARGLSPRTRRQTRAILRRALATAERYGYVARNVAALTEPPKIGATKLDDALTASEARAVLDAVRGDRFAALAEIILSLGLRKGEVLALRWHDIDAEHHTITIGGTLKRRPGGGWYIDTPKSANSTRTLPLIDSVSEALTERRRVQATERLAAGSAWHDHGFVFTTRRGLPLDERNALRWWHQLTERAGIGRRRFHATRHTAATLLHDQGVPLEVISTLLGHASLAITADVYTRIGVAAQRHAAEQLGHALSAPAPARPSRGARTAS
jgi:integrase